MTCTQGAQSRPPTARNSDTYTRSQSRGGQVCRSRRRRRGSTTSMCRRRPRCTYGLDLRATSEYKHKYKHIISICDEEVWTS